MIPLDADLWRETELGTVGPNHLVTRAIEDSRSVLYYRPLFSKDAHAVRAAQSARKMIEVIDGRQVLNQVVPPIRPWPNLQAVPGVADAAWFGVSARGTRSDKPAVLAIAHPWRDDPRLGELTYFSSALGMETPKGQPVVIAIWQTLLKEFVERGHVALVTRIVSRAIRSRAVNLGGWQPIRQVVYQHGIGLPQSIRISDQANA